MNLRNLYFTLFLFFSPLLISAQVGHHGQCGTLPNPSETQRLLKNKEFATQFSTNRDVTSYIPLKMHLIANSEGEGRIDHQDVFDAICKLNEEFEALDIQFYLHSDFNNIDNDDLYNLNYPNIPDTVNEAYVSNSVIDAINIFIGNSLSSGNSGFYSPTYDIIYMNQSFVNGEDVILTHELGHYFSIHHTFYGWENTIYDPTEPTPLYIFYGGGFKEVEFVDRATNCETSGDFLCGTPADYILNWHLGCDYTGGAVDPDSVLIDPDEHNHMAYYSFENCLDYQFTDDQEAVIFADYMNRPEIYNVPAPDINSVEETANLLSPIGQEFVESYNVVHFEWEAVPNASFYLIQIARTVASFSIIHEQAFVSSTNYTSTALDANRYYDWRISAFNKSDFCTIEYSEEGLFSTGDELTNTHNIDSSKNFSILSNLISNELFLEFETPTKTDATVFISSINGQFIQENNWLVKGGLNKKTVNIATLSKGIYFCSVKTANGVFTKRFIKI